MSEILPDPALSPLDECLTEIARLLGVALDGEQILLAVEDLIADRDLWKQRANVDASVNAAAVARLRALESGDRG